MNYQEKSKQIRRKVLDMVYKAQSSHIGSNFSCIDILTVLYGKKRPEDEVVISKGWVAASAYALLADSGVIPKEDLETYCQPGSRYIGLLEPTVPGVKCAGGSMGYGLPFAVGFALAKKIKGEAGVVYCLMGDGEMAIGTTWESALIAAHHKLDNLVIITDFNKLQAMGKIDTILGIEPLKAKWESFGWYCWEIDGHDFNEITEVIKMADDESVKDKPICIIAHTIKGKGWKRAENNNTYHYKNISDEEYQEALGELNAEQERAIY